TALGWPNRAQPRHSAIINQLARVPVGIGTFLRGMLSARTLAVATWMVALVGTLITVLLSLRIWLQLAGETGRGGFIGTAYDLSGTFVAPFSRFESTTPIRDNGILEFSSLVALEAYLIATLVVLTFLFTARLALFAGSRVVH